MKNEKSFITSRSDLKIGTIKLCEVVATSKILYGNVNVLKKYTWILPLSISYMRKPVFKI